MRKKASIKYIASLLLFGTNGVVASRIALSSHEIVFTRTLIGTVFLALIFLFSRQKPRIGANKTHTIYLLISGAAMGASWMALFEAYRQVGVSVATLAYYCGPVFVMMISPLFFKEKITIVKVISLIAVLFGLFLVNTQDLLSHQLSWGLTFGILAACMYAFMVIFNKKAESITGLENPLWQLAASFATVALFTFLKQGFSVPLAPQNLLPVLMLGIVNTGLGCYLYFSTISKLPIQTVAILGYLEPLSALLASAIFLGESLGFVQWLGAVLILGGAAFGGLFHPASVQTTR